MSLRDDLANINNLCSMLVKGKSNTEEVVEAFSIRDRIILEIESERLERKNHGG